MSNYGLEILFWITLCMGIFYIWEEGGSKPIKKKRGRKKK